MGLFYRNILNPIVREKDACEKSISVPLICKGKITNEEITNLEKRKSREADVINQILRNVRFDSGYAYCWSCFW